MNSPPQHLEDRYQELLASGQSEDAAFIGSFQINGLKQTVSLLT